MAQLVEAYALTWHPQHGCKLGLKLAGEKEWMPWMSISAANLAAVAMVLRQSPVYFRNGIIYTGAEPVEEDT